MNKWAKWMVLIIVLLAGCTNKGYDTAINNGYQSLEQGKYEDAKNYFEEAYEAKNTEETEQGKEIARMMLEAETAFDEGKWEYVLGLLDEIENIGKKGKAYDSVKEKIVQLKQDSEKLYALYTDLEAKMGEASNHRKENEYDKAVAIYDEIELVDSSNHRIQALVKQAAEELDKTKQEKKSSQNNSNSSKDEDDDSVEEGENVTKQGVSIEEAERIIREALKIPAATYVQFDHEDGDDFIIHVYDIIKNEGEVSHTATLGWYRVNKNSGEWYDLMN
ncbi:tetratricopeptide repeat protein [Robertmurraya massiliosenegalensis]|uniref:hypothetical protein n=1 Tax=Robertmurraya massiliosenegalensis TaxID=1287657 RepID=UPI0002E82410|nr:hypothetical protein [Robertmurraya massiliosenegalensis]